MGQNAGYFNKTNQLAYSFFYSVLKNGLENRYLCNVKLFIVVHEQTPWIWFLFNSIQNSHVHEPSKRVDNLNHLHITTEKNLREISLS